ncbi:MAG: hypothetical protein LBI59_08045 [Candidatus Accumulibacter sp.]|jgi:hypothetical protein|nr:hypothetical protein [Accumulibacter sp.]
MNTDGRGGRPLTPGALWRAWTAKKPGEKNLHIALAAIALAALYLTLIFPLTYREIDRIGYNLGKARARARVTTVRQPTAPPPLPSVFGGKNVREAEKERDALRRQIEETRAAVASLNNAFVPLDDSLALNALKTGLTALAEAGDMEVLGIEHIYARPEDKSRAPTPQLIQEAARGNPFQRPLLSMRARASYRGLMQFLIGLSNLPYVVAPVWSDIRVSEERNAQTNAPARRWLDITLRFAV